MSEPWVHLEDEHLLVIDKPAGVNTHRADEHGQDGMHEWVQRQRPGVGLSILHRLDKATSGLLVFGKTTEANRSLSAQFETRSIAKRYELLVDSDDRRSVTSRADAPIDGRAALTDFERIDVRDGFDRVVARPHSGRTHQVRIHAAGLGMPIIGDREHGGRAAARLFLHAAGLRLDHPVDGPIELKSAPPPSFDDASTGDGHDLAAQVALEQRTILFDPSDTDSYLWIDRGFDGFPDVRVERLGDRALVLDYREERDDGDDGLVAALVAAGVGTVFVQRRPRGGGGGLAEYVAGDPTPAFGVRELGLRYSIDLGVSATSSGLFLDQRETRRELLQADLGDRTVLNTFAHTGSLSVAAARAGADTLTLDLSKRYLEWARDNFHGNDIDPADHDFVYGDTMDWLARFAKKGRTFDMVLVDPPSSSTTRKGAKRWVADRDLHELVASAAVVCSPGGDLYVSTNLRRMTWDGFLEHLGRGLASVGRPATIETRTLPLDHRTGPGDPPYLKAAWLRLDR